MFSIYLLFSAAHASELRIRVAQLCESLSGQRLSSIVSLKKGRELLGRVTRLADKGASVQVDRRLGLATCRTGEEGMAPER